MNDPAIQLAGLRKAFGRNQVLRGIDLTIPAGRVTVLMGATGAGTSTLVKILCGVHGADAGTVT
ncbi:MAG: ATP-binding cassette domain-containing protein, partial [Defluviimonas denitrificans]